MQNKCIICRLYNTYMVTYFPLSVSIYQIANYQLFGYQQTRSHFVLIFPNTVLLKTTRLSSKIKVKYKCLIR